MKAGFVSLGCSKNLVDTEMMLGILREHGIELTPEPAEADILIVNTCAFIESAKEESITTILNMAEYKESGRCRSLIVAGCLGQRYGQELLDDMPEADAIIGTGAWNRIMEAVEESLKGHRVVIAGEDKLLYDEHTPRITTTPAYTAYVKIAEGCNNRCAFCAIPYIRGAYRSRPIEDIRDEVANLAARGVKEIILIAQDTTEYGRDLYGEPQLAKLLRTLCTVEGVHWIRTLYSYPTYFSDELIETIASEPKLVKYVDLPMQHAHDEVLRRMHRPDTQASMRALIEKLRTRIPGVTIRSTFIVGFPGETEEDFAQMLAFLEEIRYDSAYTFLYSKRSGTPAAEMADQVPEALKHERLERLMAVQDAISREKNEALKGRTLEVLVEGPSKHDAAVWSGRTRTNKLVLFPHGAEQPGDLVEVNITHPQTWVLKGETVASR